MKMAASEALYETSAPAPLSLFAVGPWERHPKRTNVDITLPHALSVIATNSWNGRILGIDEVQREYVQRYGPGDYTPIVGTEYWTWRIMVGLGFLAFGFSAAGLWLARRGRELERSRRFTRLALWFAAVPFAANTAGWLFTEMGRQPWIVQGLLLTRDAVSPRVGVTSVALTLAGFTAVYGVLAAVEGWLMARAVRSGPDESFPAATRGEPLPPLVY
jgi:cytochrome d ubiquinol oxidase subunit I